MRTVATSGYEEFVEDPGTGHVHRLWADTPAGLELEVEQLLGDVVDLNGTVRR